MGLRFYLAPTCRPLGHALTKSVARTPFPASCRQRPEKFRRGMDTMPPAQPLLAPVPDVRLIYSSLQLMHPVEIKPEDY